MSSYLGRGIEQVDNISKLDNLTFNGGTTYALTKNSSAFQAISSNAILISVSGVIQQGNFSVSGTNIVFDSAVASSETCDFIMHYGTGVAFTPADNSITDTKLNSNSVTTAKIQNDAVTKDKVDFVTDSGGASLEAKGSSGYDGAIRLNCSVNSHFTELKSASHGSYSGNLNFTLPSSTGTNGQFLQTNGSGVLSFADAGGGGFTRLGGGNATGQNLGDLPFDNVFSSTYNTYYCIYRINFVANSTQLWLRVRDGSGYKTNSNYKFILHGENWSETESAISSSGGDSKFRLTGGLGSADDDNNATGYIIFYRPYNSGIVTDVTMGATEKDESYIITSRVGAGAFQNSASLTGFGFLGSNQNIEDYDVTIFGVNQS